MQDRHARTPRRRAAACPAGCARSRPWHAAQPPPSLERDQPQRVAHQVQRDVGEQHQTRSQAEVTSAERGHRVHSRVRACQRDRTARATTGSDRMRASARGGRAAARPR
jgi:hypothetical protein